MNLSANHTRDLRPVQIRKPEIEQGPTGQAYPESPSSRPEADLKDRWNLDKHGWPGFSLPRVGQPSLKSKRRGELK